MNGYTLFIPNRLGLALLILFTVCLLLSGTIALAQDEPLATNTADIIATFTPVAEEPVPTAPAEEPPVEELPVLESALSRYETIITVLLVALVVAVSLFGGVIVAFVRQALNSLPSWAVKPIKDAATGGLDQLKTITDVTPNLIDNELEKKIREMIREVFQDEVSQAAAAQARYKSRE